MFVEYSFMLELYATITSPCDLKLKPSCIVIGIHKRVAALWPRLLKDGGRPPPWITFDAEHSTLDSSDDDDDDDDDIDEPLKLVTRV